jgi:hydroxymethylglutaryl-CoA lyase
MAAVLLEDESLRDGLQAEKRMFSLEEKTALFRLLVGAGIKRVQVGSFVHPKSLPQMADTDSLINSIKNEFPDVLITALVLNERGLERAGACGLKHLSMSVSVSNTHSLKNVRRSAAEALADMSGLIRRAVASGIQVRAGIQCSFGCVYEGAVPEEKVIEAALALAEAGAGELNIADSTGMANPKQVKRVVGKVLETIPGRSISLHLHDTRGLGLANMMAGYETGARIFDVAAGGLGGCPAIQGAAGNIPAEDAVNLFEQIGAPTGINLRELCKVVDKYEELLDRELPGRMNRVIKSQAGCSN